MLPTLQRLHTYHCTDQQQNGSHSHINNESARTHRDNKTSKETVNKHNMRHMAAYNKVLQQLTEKYDVHLQNMIKL